MNSPILQSSREVKIDAVIEVAIAEEFFQSMEGMFRGRIALIVAATVIGIV